MRIKVSKFIKKKINKSELKEIFKISNIIKKMTRATRNKTTTTNKKNVFAIGDISRGASLVVWAIKDGQEVAENIIHKLNTSLNIAAE